MKQIRVYAGHVLHNGTGCPVFFPWKEALQSPLFSEVYCKMYPNIGAPIIPVTKEDLLAHKNKLKELTLNLCILNTSRSYAKAKDNSKRGST